MDMKQFAGKNVAIQFKPGMFWYVHCASDQGVPMIKLRSPDVPEPVQSPFLMGEVQEDGAVRICTDAGGELDVWLDADIIFTVAAVHKPAEVEVSPFVKGPAPRPAKSVIIDPN